MARKAIIDKCHLCGIHTKLSFEHVPPRAAFNNRPRLVFSGNDLFKSDFDNLQRGQISQRGAGAYTLCERCNNITGQWYGRDFVDFAYQAMSILHATRGRASLYYTFHIFPLRVIKQILCMFFSVNNPKFREANPELEKFILNRELNGLNPHYQLFAYFNASGRSRHIGGTGVLNIPTRKIRVMSEISFPPLGYLLCFNSEPPDESLEDLTFFAKYRYNDWKHISIRLPVRPIYTCFPGDYRDREQVLGYGER